MLVDLPLSICASSVTRRTVHSRPAPGAAPGPQLKSTAQVQVQVPRATLLAEHTRGLGARHGWEVGHDIRTPRGLVEVGGGAFDAHLTAPTRVSPGWVRDATAPTIAPTTAPSTVRATVRAVVGGG